jgi:hypothetical protein
MKIGHHKHASILKLRCLVSVRRNSVLLSGAVTDIARNFLLLFYSLEVNFGTTL